MTPPTGLWTTWTARYRRIRQRVWARRGIDLAVLAALVFGLGAWQTRTHLSSGEMPAAVLTTLAGERVSLESLRGKPVLVAFWAPWCSVCAAESQNLSWAKRVVGERARVVSIAASFENVAQVRAYVRDHGVDYPVLLGDDALLQAFHVEAFPTVYFLDAHGRVQRSATGYTTTLGILARLLL
jgi:thiol-disulfide isomerase/thioredoxin